MATIRTTMISGTIPCRFIYFLAKLSSYRKFKESPPIFYFFFFELLILKQKLPNKIPTAKTKFKFVRTFSLLKKRINARRITITTALITYSFVMKAYGSSKNSETTKPIRAKTNKINRHRIIMCCKAIEVLLDFFFKMHYQTNWCVYLFYFVRISLWYKSLIIYIVIV